MHETAPDHNRTARLLSRAEPVLLPFYPRQIYLALVELGIDVHALFNDLDFGAEQLEDEHYRLTIAQHEAFILRAMELTADTHLALKLDLEQDIHTSNLALLTIANSGQIGSALQAITRYFHIITRVFQIRAFNTDPKPAMDIELILDHDLVSYFAMSSFALFMDRFFLRGLEGAHLVERVEMTLPAPAGFQQVQDQFPFDMRFSKARTRICFHKALLDRPLKQADPQTVRLLRETTERQLQALDEETSLVGAARALLVEHIVQPPNLDETARALNLSSRGLRRKLAQSGTSYQKLLDEVRERLATRMLTETAIPISTVADELGFNNASDFGRAFKRWSGRPPSSLRQDTPLAN